VAYVRFDVSNFLGRIDVLETNVMAYYREHPEFYSVTGTNGETSARPFAEVKADAERRLRLERASAAAEEAAATLAFKLVPGRLTTAVPLVQAAAAAGIAVHTTGLFSASATLPGVDAKSFSRIALELDPADASLRFSDAIVGSNAVYVAECLERREKYIPAFDAVSADVMPLAASNAAARVFEERVQKARADIVAALADGKSFRTAAGALGFNVATTAVFAVYGGLPEGAPFADALPGAVASLDKHEVSEATPVAGGVLLAYVADRLPAESATIDLLCAQMQNSMIRYRAGAVFRAWTEDMLTAAAFTDLVATASQDLPPAPIDDFLDL
jgi:hypothetical protein